MFRRMAAGSCFSSHVRGARTRSPARQFVKPGWRRLAAALPSDSLITKPTTVSVVSPAGRHVAFLSERGSTKTQKIHLMPADGGEASPLTRSEGAVSAFLWAPDSSRIAYIMADAKTAAQTEAEKAGQDWQVVSLGITRVIL